MDWNFELIILMIECSLKVTFCYCLRWRSWLLTKQKYCSLATAKWYLTKMSSIERKSDGQIDWTMISYSEHDTPMWIFFLDLQESRFSWVALQSISSEISSQTPSNWISCWFSVIKSSSIAFRSSFSVQSVQTSPDFLSISAQC